MFVRDEAQVLLEQTDALSAETEIYQQNSRGCKRLLTLRFARTGIKSEVP